MDITVPDDSWMEVEKEVVKNIVGYGPSPSLKSQHQLQLQSTVVNLVVVLYIFRDDYTE